MNAHLLVCFKGDIMSQVFYPLEYAHWQGRGMRLQEHKNHRYIFLHHKHFLPKM